MALPLLDDALELATLLRPAWASLSESIPAWHPRNEDPDPEPDPKDDPKPDPDPKDEADPDPDPEPDPEPPADPKGELAKLREELRKHRRTESRWKETKKERDELAAKLKDREDADKSEQEKAIEAARQEGEKSASSKYEEQRRDDKIENAVTKLALKGFKVTIEDGDEKKEKTLKFADPDDAQLRLERAIRKGDLSYDDVYSDGTVNQDAVTEFLRELLEENTHLQASDGTGKSRTVEGGADGGRGAGAKTGPSVEDDLKQIRRNAKAA